MIEDAAKYNEKPAAQALSASTGSQFDMPQWFELLEISRDCANAPHLENLLVWQDLEDGYDDAVAMVAYTLGDGKWKQCPDGEDCVGIVIAWAPLPKVSIPENVKGEAQPPAKNL